MINVEEKRIAVLLEKLLFIPLMSLFVSFTLPAIADSQCYELEDLRGDTSDIGHPESPVPGLPKDTPPPGFLSFDEENYYVNRTNMHGREIRVAFSKEITQLDESLRRNFSQFIFNVWSYYWKIFGGFSYANYTVVVVNGPMRFAGGWGLGYEVEGPDVMPGCFPSSCENYICASHEIFHAWNPHSLDTGRQQAWFIEGATNYYSSRAYALFYQNVRTIDSIQKDFDKQDIRAALNRYLNEIKGTAKDIPLTEAGELYWGTDNSWVYYNKGMLVSYLFDKRLNEDGSNLDKLLKYMYAAFGYGIGAYETNDMKVAAETLTGKEYDQFFSDYIFGTTSLPLDENSNFEFFINTTSPELIKDYAIIKDQVNIIPIIAPLLLDTN